MEPADNEAEVGAAVAGDWMGGGRHTDVSNVLYRGSPGGTYIQVGYRVHVPSYWKKYGRVPLSVGMKNDGVDASAEPGQYVSVLFPGNVHSGGGCEVGVDIRRPLS